jgi:hypothetical protein
MVRAGIGDRDEEVVIEKLVPQLRELLIRKAKVLDPTRSCRW